MVWAFLCIAPPSLNALLMELVLAGRLVMVSSPPTQFIGHYRWKCVLHGSQGVGSLKCIIWCIFRTMLYFQSDARTEKFPMTVFQILIDENIIIFHSLLNQLFNILKEIPKSSWFRHISEFGLVYLTKIQSWIEETVPSSPPGPQTPYWTQQSINQPIKQFIIQSIKQSRRP